MTRALVFIKGMTDFFTSTPIGRALGIALIILIALMMYTSHVRKNAAESAANRVAAKVEKVTAKEEKRQTKVVAKIQKKTTKTQKELEALRADNERKLQEITNATSVDDNAVVFDADSLRRLDAIR